MNIRVSFIAVVLFAAGSAFGGEFMDTRLTWTFGDDDILKDAGEVVPDSPKPGIGDRKGYEMFMDNLNSKTKGRENLTHIALYKKMEGFITGVTTEAGLVIKLDIGALSQSQSPKVSDVIADDGTFLRIAWTWKEAEKDRYNLGLTFFPFDTERFRLGYLWDISWGGGNIFSTRRAGPAPGFKFDINVGRVSGYVGFKTARVSQVVRLGSKDVEEITVQETNYGVLGGVGVDITEWMRFDVGGGYFQQGTFNFEGLIGEKVFSVGFSGRLSFHKGMSIQTSIDYMLYRNDPNVNCVEWWRERYQKGVFSWSASIEGTFLSQRLSHPTKYGTTKMQPAYAGAFQGKIKYGFFRAQAVALLRNLEFILQNVPSLTPFVALPETGISTSPEYFFAATFDYYFEKPHLMPYATAGVQFPAKFKSGDSVQVIRDVTRRDRLPPGFDVTPVYQIRLGTQWDLSDFMSILGNIQIVHDENLTRLVIDPSGERREFQRPNQFGFNIIARARF